MKKKILFIAAILIMALTVLVIYLNKVFFPIQFKQIVLQKAEEYLKRPVSFESISFHPIKGIVITHLNIAEKDATEIPLLHIDEISANILYAPIFRDKKIIIPQLTIKKPAISLKHYSGQEWNFIEIVEAIKIKTAAQAKNPPEKEKTMSFILGAINVIDCDLTIMDRHVIPSFLETMEDINIKGSLSPQKGIKFSLEANLPKSQSNLKLQGDADFGFHKISARFITNNLQIVQYLKLYYKNDNLDLTAGILKTADISIERQSETFTAQGRIEGKDIDIKWMEKQFQGGFNIPNFSFYLNPGKSALLKANVEISDSKISLGEDHVLRGNLSSPELTLAWQPEQIQLSGPITTDNSEFQINKQQSLTGELQSQNFSMTITPDDQTAHTDNIATVSTASEGAQIPLQGKKIDLKTAASIKDLVFTLDENRSVRGQLTTDPLSVTVHQGNITLSGNVQLSAASIQLDQEKKISGDIAASSTVLSITPEKVIDLTSNLQASNFVFTLNDHQSVAGALTINALKLNAQEGNFLSQGNLELLEADIVLSSDKRIQGTVTAPNLEFSLKNKNAHLKITDPLQLSEGRIAFADKSADGNLKLTGNFLSDLNAPGSLEYNGVLFPDITILRGIPMVNELRDISGKIGFLNNQIHIEELHFSGIDTAVELSGSVTNFSDPALDLKASTQKFDLSKIALLAPGLLEKTGVTPSGQAQVTLNIQDKISNLSPEKIAGSTISAEITLKETTLTGTKFPDSLTDIQGVLNYSANSLAWKNLQAVYQKKDFHSSGQLTDFTSPKIKGTLISSAMNFQLTTSAQWREQILSFDFFKGDYLNSRFNLSGEILLSEQLPQLNLKGQVEFNLKDLSAIAPQMDKTWEAIKPEGTVSWNGAMTGAPSNWKSWNMNFIALSPQILISGYSVKDLSIKANQSEGTVKRFDITANLYDGKFKAEGSIKVSDEQMPFEIKADLKETNLQKLKTATIWKEKEVTGFFSANAEFKGPLMDWKAMKGSGSALIHDGNIWQLNLLKGLGKIIFTSDYENIPIKEVSADFKVQNQRVETDNLAIKSPVFTVLGKGWVGFNNQLDFNLNTQFETKLPSDTETIQEKISTLLTQFGDIVNIKVSGPMSNPKFSPPIPAPGRIIEKGFKLFLEGVKDVL